MKRSGRVGAGLAIALFGMAGAQAQNAGVERATQGATDAITSPVRIVDGVREDTQALGPVGVVTGVVKGGVQAAGQAAIGAANIGVGILETLVSPFIRK